MTLQQIVDHWSVQLQGAYTGLINGHRFGQQGVKLSAYKPTVFEKDGTAFFLSFDNAGCHSFYVGGVKHGSGHEHKPGVPLLQLITMPAQGHDAHQIVEHSIGTTKSNVRHVLRAAKKNGQRITLAMLYDVMQS